MDDEKNLSNLACMLAGDQALFTGKKRRQRHASQYRVAGGRD
jgi:hypothetical protein